MKFIIIPLIFFLGCTTKVPEDSIKSSESIPVLCESNVIQFYNTHNQNKIRYKDLIIYYIEEVNIDSSYYLISDFDTFKFKCRADVGDYQITSLSIPKTKFNRTKFGLYKNNKRLFCFQSSIDSFSKFLFLRPFLKINKVELEFSGQQNVSFE